MRLRVVRCPEDAHALPWVRAQECEHWPRKCPARRGKHKLKRGEPGYDVLVPGFGLKRYLGKWAGPDASVWVPAPIGNLIHCTGCDLKGAQ